MTPNDADLEPVGLGIIGLGMAGAVMVHAAAAHPKYVLRAGADPHAAPREAFARDFNARAYADARELVADAAVQAVYIATPHQFHALHAILAAEHGKHIVLEKPMALTLADCDAIIAAVERNRVHLIVGHTHGFDPAVRLMRGIIARGELGRLGMINSFNYTNYLYRPRRPEELDTSKGGGILFNQVPHQVDTARVLGGGLVRSVRAHTNVLDLARPTEAGCMALLQFDGGAAASLTYSGYDHFDSDEWHSGIGEGGRPKPLSHGAARRALAAVREESGLRTKTLAYGAGPGGLPPHQPHFGVTIVTCAEGDMRASADGVLVYDRNGMREIAIPRRDGMPGRREVLDDMLVAIRTGRRPRHDGRWGKATVEVALAILRSSREGREIELRHQVAVDDSAHSL
jgi:phthalate 4,5-cis-dihydrodiol dehydrogenase